MPSKPFETPFRSDLLLGKTALVTGAGKGIGRQCALSLAAVGATVIAVARTKKDLDSLQHEVGNKLTILTADATSEEFLEHLSVLSSIDILVNNLGTNTPQPFIDIEDAVLDRMLDTNIRTVFRITQRVVKNMLDEKIKGSIINISSQMGHVGSPRRTVYCATKHAIEGFTKALGVELGPQGIRVNTVCPTFIETPMTKPMLKDPEFNRFVIDKIPLGHIGQTSDVANAVVYLASSASEMVTGSSLMVDGGWTAH